MVGRSLKATEAGITKAETALTSKGWSRQELAECTTVAGKVATQGIDIQVIHKFFTGKPVDRRYFVAICKALELSWEEISGLPPAPTGSSQTDSNDLLEIENLVVRIRLRLRPDIQEQCGKMRVLDMNQPIGLEDIYTDVNILDTITGNRRLELSELLRDFDPESEDFERCGLSRVVEKRVPGLDVVRRYPKLMVLGKPGAGKTTFLKYLAIQCIRGEFQAQKIPIFITLKDFAETINKPTLLEYIKKMFTFYEVTEEEFNKLLVNRRLLILLDGLDEVREEDRKRISKDVEEFSRQYFFSEDFRIDQRNFLAERTAKFSKLEEIQTERRLSRTSKDSLFILLEEINCSIIFEDIVALKYLDKKGLDKDLNGRSRDQIKNKISENFNKVYPDLSEQIDQGLNFLSDRNSNKNYSNNFIITCRIAAREFYFKEFTEVEVADFDDKQIKIFSQKWFQRKNPLRGKDFIQKLDNQRSVKELAINPLLLTLFCLVFETSSDFPTNRSELYEEGVSVLLKKWDAERSIERDIVYRRLSTARKEDLLSHIAWITFNKKDYFFKQKQAELYIAEYIQNLPGARTNSQALHFDSEVVLKSIEAQHGLLVERAKGIYSFSHLTFHEYFTARRTVTISDPKALEDFLGYLVEHMTEKRWREVILLAVGMLPSADRLFQLMKQRTDEKIKNHKNSDKLCAFLTQIKQKSLPADVPYQAALKALYFSLFQDSKTSCEQGFTSEEMELLKEYHEANRLLMTFINSDCYVTLKVRQDIEKNLLLPR
ncbi:NACHT domain-containing protein [Nostoc sp. LEGE 06077]|uniref:NACHT domain-containing protein n=1 Tax=Nostoc sp. LEGE 06077 TaxID=915325 RepID=UPI001D148B8B|nr:NACHT domain-containing protein [Nostoc sp. LEGE 06077]